MSLLKSKRSRYPPCSSCLSIVLVCLPSWRLFGSWFLSLCGLPEENRVSSKCVRVCHMPSLCLLICRGNTTPLLRLGSSSGCIGYVSCSVLRYICPRVVMSSFLPTAQKARENGCENIFLSRVRSRGYARVWTINKLDEGRTNADDQMMLVQHHSGDLVMS